MTPQRRYIFIGILAPPALIGVIVFAVALFQAVVNPWTDESLFEAASRAWAHVLEPLGTLGEPLPTDWEEEQMDAYGMDPSKPISDETSEFLAMNNAFVVTCAFLSWVGLLAFVFLEASARGAQSLWRCMLRRVGIGGAISAAYLIFGHAVAFGDPTDFFISTPNYAWYATDPVAHDMAGLTPWADFFSMIPFLLLTTLLVMGFCPAGLRTSPAAVVAVLIGCFVFPLVCSWNWGGGWLSQLGSVDFAGAGLVHLQGGAAAVPIAVALAVCRRRRARLNVHPAEAPNPAAPWLRLVALGLVMVFAVGLNLSALLLADQLGSRLLIVLAISMSLGAAIGFGWGFVNRKRSPVETAVLCALAGAVYVSGATVVPLPAAVALGIAAGAITGLILFLLDSLEIPDPLGVIPVHLVGGAISCLLPLMVDPDGMTTIISQFSLLLASGGPAFSASATVTMVFVIAGHFDRELPKSATE